METRKTLLLHIGHGKTGSSFLQTCFASSINALKAEKIVYPIESGALERALNGQTTEGNYPPISLERGHSLERLQEIVKNASAGPEESILLSNEGIFQSIVLHDFLAQATRLLPEYKIRILLFTRDPFEHLISAYQELLKADLVGDIEDLFRKSSVPRNVGTALDKADEVGVEVKVHNFDRHRDSLKTVTEEWLEITAGTLRSGPKPSVNRSMDRSEILVQRAFNKYVGRHARAFVADALASELPDLKPTKPFIDEAVLSKFIDRMHVDIREINDRISQEEHYRVPSLDEAKAMLPSEEEAQKVVLTTEQLDVLARNIAKFLPHIWRKDTSENEP